MSRTKGCKKGGRQIYGREITKKKVTMKRNNRTNTVLCDKITRCNGY